MKKVISLVLCFVLLVSLGITAAAAPDASEGALTDRLKAITLKVKETLGIGDDFTAFNGTLNETDTASLWSLNWSSDKEQIYVSANENGTVVSYNDYVSGVTVPSGGKLPKFPALSLNDAKAVAGAFLNKVMDTKIVSVDLSGSSSLDYSGNAMYYLYGPMKLYGIETPVNISVSVSAAMKQVTNYYRGDYGQDYSGITKPSAAADKTAAAASLKSTLNMKLTYALPGDGTHTARLQYQPNPDGSYVVDAATGKLVDLSKLDWSGDLRNSGSGKTESAAPTADSGAAITPIEQASIDKLKDVLPQSELEKIVRAYTELGLTSDFKLQNVSYYTYENENKEVQITAGLQFINAPKDTDAQYRYITMDAKAGKLISVGGNIIYIHTQGAAPSYKYTSAQTEAVARSFAGKILPDEMKMTALGDTSGSSSSESAQYYTFYRANQGIIFPENYISVAVDKNTGFVVSFYYNWYDDEVTFVSPTGVISAEAAAATYSEGTGITLKYVSVPRSVQSSGLLLAYTSANQNVWGVNALTGELLKNTVVADVGLTYDDLDGNPYADMINKLASFGVGFAGGSFKPSAQLTQLDALIFIESANGRQVRPIPLVSTDVSGGDSGKVAAFSPVSATETDDIYNLAYSMGILTPAEKDPNKLVTKAEFAKYLVNALGYGEVASLEGIFKAGFKDDKSIPAALMGHVAVAKGLGIIKGDQNGRFKPNDVATRTVAAIMLYNCMNRK